MLLQGLTKKSDYEWWIEPRGKMRVPGVIFASPELICEMDDKVAEQVMNVASLPGIVTASYAMPDAHWGYGFPIGGVAAFDPKLGGVVSAGGVGFDISCGVRTLRTGLTAQDVRDVHFSLAEELFRAIPAGMGRKGPIVLDGKEMDRMLNGGAVWAVSQGYGLEEDLVYTEERGKMAGADPDQVTEDARKRQSHSMGTLGSGNHYLEVQRIAEILDESIAEGYGLRLDETVVSIHCGSRGLGHQVGTEFLRSMVMSATGFGIELPDRELACAPIDSDLGRKYLGAMRAAINCALANRQIITHLARQAFRKVTAKADLTLLYDVSHNTCKVERHRVDGEDRELYVHRKGATRSFGPGHPDLPDRLKPYGQPVLIGGSMGTASYVLAGVEEAAERSFASACHGAGRSMSRGAALKLYSGRQIVDELAGRGILIRSPSSRGVAEEAPGAYKDVGEVIESAWHAGLAKPVARLEPMITIKG